MPPPLTVHRLRLIAQQPERRRAEAWLGAIALDRLGLGPQEVLHVPRLALRLLEAGRGLDAPPERILASLRELLKRAERDPRPGSARDGPSRFSSRSRYLAWLAGLWLTGGPAGRAAAAAATGASSMEAWQRQEILGDGARLAAVAHRLALARLAGGWAATFGPVERDAASSALRRSFGLDLFRPCPPVYPGADRGPPAPTRPVEEAAMHRAATRAVPASVVQAAALLRAGGLEWGAEGEEARAILIAACALADRPADARLPFFPHAVRAVAGAGAAPAPEPRLRRSGDVRVAELREQMRHSIPVRRAAAPTGVRESEGERQPSENRWHVATGVRQETISARPGLGDAPSTQRPVEHRHPGSGFDSDYAGLLFLLNAFVALGLYPDFSEPEGFSLAPSPLWLAGQIGHWRFAEAFRRDPLCRWIHRHARPGPLPRRWRVRGGWLGSFPRAVRPRIVRAEARSTVWHSAGFPLIDAPHFALPPRLKTGARAGPARSRLPRTADRRWIACLGQFLERRIQIATGGTAGLGLLALRGRVAVDELEITACFDLSAHPIALRIAGLDRDVGWQPAEGRSIGFRFE